MHRTAAFWSLCHIKEHIQPAAYGSTLKWEAALLSWAVHHDIWEYCQSTSKEQA